MLAPARTKVDSMLCRAEEDTELERVIIYVLREDPASGDGSARDEGDAKSARAEERMATVLSFIVRTWLPACGEPETLLKAMTSVFHPS